MDAKNKICLDAVNNARESLAAIFDEALLGIKACDAVIAEHGNCDLAVEHLEIHVDCLGPLRASAAEQARRAMSAVNAARICAAVAAKGGK